LDVSWGEEGRVFVGHIVKDACCLCTLIKQTHLSQKKKKKKKEKEKKCHLATTGVADLPRFSVADNIS